MRTYVDSDVLIWHLRGEKKAAQFLRRLSQEAGSDLWIGALQRAEIVFFMRPAEADATRTLLSRFKTQPVTQDIVDQGGEIYRRWNPSHGSGVADALLAASVAETGGRLFTLNVKHYPMPDVPVLKAW